MPQANTKLPYDKTDKYAIWEYSKQLLGPDFEEAGMELKCTPLKELCQYRQRRRSDKEFARAEAKRKRLVREEMEKELQEQFHIPAKVVKASHEDYE